MYLEEKRDKRGLTLSHRGFELGNEVSNYSMFFFKKTKIYKIFCKTFDKKCVDHMFTFYFYQSSFPFVFELAVIEKQKLNNKHYESLNIAMCNNLYLKSYLKKKKISYTKKINFIIIKVRFNKYIRKIKQKLKNKFNQIFFQNQLVEKTNFNIGVNYQEGLNVNKQNDLYWYNKKNFKPENVLIYFIDNQTKQRYHDEYDIKQKIKEFRFNSIDVWRCHNKELTNFIKNAIYEINLIKKNNPIEKKLSIFCIELLKEINFWYLFYKINNIKIDFDSGTDKYSLIKKVALRKLNSCTVGKLRSFVGNRCFYYRGALSKDILFVPNLSSVQRVKRYSLNLIENIIVNGLSYQVLTKDNISEINKIKKFFKKNKKKFIILLTDNMYSENKFNLRDVSLPIYDQLISSKYYNNFYDAFINLCLKDSEIGLIIKSKRSGLIERSEVYKKLLDIQKKGICYIIKKPFRKYSLLYALVSNFTAAIGASIPTTLMDIILKNKYGAFCDYPNLKSIEKEIYKEENNVVFKDPYKLADKILEFKSHKIKKLGNWASFKDLQDPIKNNDGSMRVSFYVKKLFYGLKKYKKYKEAIKYADMNFKKKYKYIRIFNGQ